MTIDCHFVMDNSSDLRHVNLTGGGVLEFCQCLSENQFDAADGTVTMFGHDDLGDILFERVFFVLIRPVDEHYDVGVLLEAA